jgi:ATP-dependent helicase/nuclease subunit A
MGTKWTNEQLKVINTRNRNILVSAAAGSGKTAVLVERIIAMVTDKDKPIDVDKLLVVTFTNAAASEMRERLMKALSKALMQDRNNEHLQKQMTYIQNAKITTIDAFCLGILKDNFGEADIDPGFRIGNNDELELLKKDTVSEVINSYFEAGDEQFLEFMEDYVDKSGRSAIEEIILDLYEKSMSNVNPAKWLGDMLLDYKDITPDKILDSVFFKKLFSEAKKSIHKAYEAMRMALYYSDKAGIYEYEEIFLKEQELLKQLGNIEDFNELKKQVDNIKYDRLPSIKKDRGIDDREKKKVVKFRESAKKYIKDIKEKFLNKSLDEYSRVLKLSYDNVAMLLKLTCEFMEEYLKVKKEKNIVDFAQVEQLTYNILVKDGEVTDTAKQISEDFYEILIDEYQDSNYLQEAILGAVSKKHKGINNIFMVGDVKQSIYGFRNAKPELFVEKFESYTANDDENMKICLSKNFRSRKQVIETCNFIFEQVMTKEFSDISYDEEQKLYLGAAYEDNDQCETEIIVIDRNAKAEGSYISENSGKVNGNPISGGSTSETSANDEFTEEAEGEEDELLDITYIEAEAGVIADKIKELVANEQKVLDKNTNTYRNIRFSDIAIIVRTMRNLGDTIMQVVEQRNIPIESISTTGYFSAFEIRVLLAYLEVIDNVRQDIPLVCVLRNVYRFNENELAQIKGESKGSYFDGLNMYNGYLNERVQRVLEDLEALRKMVPYTSIYELINTILIKTGFKDYLLAMGNGNKRIANVEMLLKKAVQYENSSYSGLFNFIRYIERVQQVELDEGEAKGYEEENDSVKLMTIHKSKGLEFPVVIVAGMGRQFNEMDYKKTVVVGKEGGLGIDYIDKDKRIRYQSPIKKALTIMGKEADRAEELRVLYVALTRAKEKLIMTGSCDINGKLKNLLKYANYEEKAFKSYMIMECKSFIEIILLAYMRNISMNSYINSNSEDIGFDNGISIGLTSPVYNSEAANAKFKVINLNDITYKAVERQYFEKEMKESIEHFNSDIVYDAATREILENRMSYRYPYPQDMGLTAKVSVSDVKHRYMSDDIEETVDSKVMDYSDSERKSDSAEKATIEKIVVDEDMPRFLRGEEEINEGAKRGTSYHRIFELIDYSKDIESLEATQEMIEEIVRSGRISKADADLVSPKKIFRFLNSNIGKRMKAAALNGKLYREKQFVMGDAYNKIIKEVDSTEMVLVQGIIDAMFEENGKLIIVDYKTDNVADIRQLETRYKTQLELYADAVQLSLGKEVGEKIIYSTKFGDELVL